MSHRMAKWVDRISWWVIWTECFLLGLLVGALWWHK